MDLCSAIYDPWVDGARVKLSWIPSRIFPQEVQFTTSGGICFYKEDIVLWRHPRHGWSNPTSTIQAGETIEDTLLDEIKRTLFAEVSCYEPIGYTKVEWLERGTDKVLQSVGGAHYWVFLSELHPFQPSKEVLERRLFSPQDYDQMLTDPIMKHYLARALKAHHGRTVKLPKPF